MSDLKLNIIRNLSNVPGWSTKRKIVVIESDDWGSVRMPSLNAFENLKKAGIDESSNHYNKFDSLECNDDLTMLFDVLSKHKDSSGRNPVITAVNIVANPDFDRIKSSGFSEYFFEPFTETLNRYPSHNDVYQLYKVGITNRLFVPVFHGREHLNVNRWMSALKNGHKSTHIAFNQGLTGISKAVQNEPVINYQAAFDLDMKNDLLFHEHILNTGLELFKVLFGYNAEYFVPTNGPFNNSLEKVLHLNGIKYINTAKIQHEPLGDGKFKKNYRYIGLKNSYGQRYITRNCFFEPSGMKLSSNTDWVNNCLKEVETAFRWGKPAIISTHRVNYTGFLSPQNRANGLKQLHDLLNKIIKRWPCVEFLTSVELGHLVDNQ